MLQRRAAAQATGRAAGEDPQRAILGGVAEAVSEIGASAFLRLLARARATPASAIDLGLDEMPGITIDLGLEQTTMVDEGLHWLAWATAAYQLDEAAVLSTLRELGISKASLLYLSPPSTSFRQPIPHIIGRDADRKALVVAIRGTGTLRDILSDMAARPIPFAGGAAHTGMAAAVDGLLHYDADAAMGVRCAQPAAQATAEGAPATPPAANFAVPFVAALAKESVELQGALPAQGPLTVSGRGFDPLTVTPALDSVGLGGVAVIVQRALRTYPDHRVVITGHSLGAGVAALLTVKLYRIILGLRVKSLRGMSEGGEASAQPRLLSSIVPPRPLSCWAYAAPSCMTPELAVLSSLSTNELEGAMISDPVTTARILGPVAAERVLAARAGHEAELSTADAECIATWPSWMHDQPLVTSVVYGHDLVPRLTVDSLKALAAKAREEGGLSVGEACIACVLVPISAAVGAVRAFIALITRTIFGRSAPPPPAPPAEQQPHPPLDATGIELSDEHSAWSSMGRLEAAQGQPADPLSSAARATVATQEEALQTGQFELRLREAAVPEPVVRFVLARAKDGRWFHASQRLVAPGAIYWVTRAPPTGASHAGAAQFRVRRVVPALMHELIESSTMASDHMIGEYRVAMASAAAAARAGGAGSGGGAPPA
jgi:hypothetical protein